MPLNSHTIQQLIHRINYLTPESKGHWGRMTVTEMLGHCAAGIKMAFGDVPSKVRVGPVRSAIVRFIFVDLISFPKNAPTPPELNIQKKLKLSGSFQQQKDALIAQLERLNNTPEDYEFAIHPIFRKLTRKQWGKLAYKHLDHHLKQFGV
jgi:hypothetical protein